MREESWLGVVEETLVHYADSERATHSFPVSALVLSEWKLHKWEFCEHMRDHEREVWVERTESLDRYTHMICVRCAKSKGYAW